MESALARSIERLEKIARRNDCRVVAAWEDRRWETVPLMQTLGMRFPEDRLTVFCGDCPDQPAKLFSAAADARQGRDPAVSSGRAACRSWDAVAAACRDLESGELDWLGFVGPQAGMSELCTPGAEERFYFHYLCCGRPLAALPGSGPTDEFPGDRRLPQEPLLQREFDADYWRPLAALRSEGRHPRRQAGGIALDLGRFPVAKGPARAASSFARLPRAHGRCAGDAEEAEGPRQIRGRSSPEPAGAPVTRLMGELPADSRRLDRPPAYKIAVTGGPWEYVHNRLYFYNPFAELEGQGLFTYVPLAGPGLLEPQRDLRGVDAVVISRGRHANVRNILDYCRRQSIATIYMIDDNWFWVGKDWADPYAPIFAPGLPEYEMFLTCLRECDAVMVYNDLVAEDVRAARQAGPPAFRQCSAGRFRGSDQASHTEAEDRRVAGLAARDRRARWPAMSDRCVTATGHSRHWLPRRSGAAPPIKAVLFGGLSPQQLQFFGNRAAVLPFVGYEAYAAALGALQPDILIAPLDRSRTSMSKCPIKYLDYSIAGAAGVYSDMSPYSQTIVDAETGLLVRGEDAASWAAAIDRLIEDESLRRSIASGRPPRRSGKVRRRPWSRRPSPRPCGA